MVRVVIVVAVVGAMAVVVVTAGVVVVVAVVVAVLLVAEVLVVVDVVVATKALATVSSISISFPRRVAASAWVAGESVAMMDPRANWIGMVANPAMLFSCSVLRMLASSTARSVAS